MGRGSVSRTVKGMVTMRRKMELAGKGVAGLNSSPQCTCLSQARLGQNALAPKVKQGGGLSPSSTLLGSQSLVCQGLNCKHNLEGKQREQVWAGASGNLPTSSCLQQPKTQAQMAPSGGCLAGTSCSGLWAKPVEANQGAIQLAGCSCAYSHLGLQGLGS